MITLDQDLAKKFLSKNSIQNPTIKKVAGDASFRSYYRIFSGNEIYILMFAPPKYEDVKPFIKIDKLLCENGFFAPKIYDIDEENGFLLLEDFGDDTYSRVLQKDFSLAKEYEIYQRACDVLLDIEKIKSLPSNIDYYDDKVLLREVMLFVDWYLKLKNKKISEAEINEFKNLFLTLFASLSSPKTLVLRDYHADNLMVLEKSKVGLLDFQDALIGSSAYDLVSLIEDARRDIAPENSEKILQYYLAKYDGNKDVFMRDYKILSLQRNIKIIGIFARLSIRDKKDNYLKFLPRVLNFIDLRLSSDNFFADLRNFLNKFL